MACDAIARLYDVDEDSVKFKRLRRSDRYDQATFAFRAREGKSIDLDKLHESVWATRLSGGTRSGLVSLEVTAIGHVASPEKTASQQTTGPQETIVLRVASSGEELMLRPHPDANHAAVFDKLRTLPAESVVKLTGIIDDYKGRWPDVLRTKPKKPRRILVTSFEVLESSAKQTQGNE